MSSIETDQAQLQRYALGVGAWRWNPTTNAFVSSVSWANMLGYDHVLGNTLHAWLNLIIEEDRRSVELALLTLSEGLSDRFECEYRARHSDGSLRWMLARGVGRVAEDGAREIAGYQDDVSQKKSAELELRQSETRFRTLIERSNEAIAVQHRGRFVYANPRMVQMLGLSDVHELMGRIFLEVVHPDDVRDVVERLRRVALCKEGSPIPFEMRLFNKDRREVAVEASLLELEYEGRPSTFTTFRDVTERRRMQARLAQADRMASLGTLAAGVAHEINNPLAYTNASLESLLEEIPQWSERISRLREELTSVLGLKLGLLPDELLRMLEPAAFDDILQRVADAHEGARRVQSIVVDLKQFSRSDEGSRVPVELSQVLRRTLKMALHEIKYRARVVEDFAEVPKVLGDEGRLGQLFLNLLVNAAHAIETDNVNDNEIRLTIKEDAGEVVVQVSDTGSGIAEEILPRLFEPFFTTKPAGMGSGLGLSICRHIAEEHGGVIDVRSQRGIGTTVSVRLPQLRRDPLKKSSATSSGLFESVRPNAPRGRLLLVDDEPILCRVLKRGLGREHDVVVAGEGSTAISILSDDSEFDVILCDMMMLGVSGQDVYEWIAAHQPQLTPRVIFITGGAITRRSKTFLEQVKNPVLEKPINMPLLRTKIAELLELPRPIQHSEASTASPVSSGGGDRRRGRRVTPSDISGLLQAKEPGQRFPISVVDFSESGLRVKANAETRSAELAECQSLVLLEPTGTGFVEARLRMVRQENRQVVCFTILEMDEASRKTYSRWLARELTRE